MAAVLVTVGISAVTAANSLAAPSGPGHCAARSGRLPDTVAPAQVGMDAAGLAKAVAYATAHNRLNVQVFRRNCLIASGPRNTETGHLPWNVWSVTKSVVSLVTGIAIDQGKLDPRAAIGSYLPAGQGDARHRAITVENLLTETSGLRQAVVAEGITGVVPVDPDSPLQALGLPLDYRPGTQFVYSQRTVDLLVYTVEQAVGVDFQTFAQQNLFEPLGIRADDYYWKRDRSGHTYGYAHLLLPPDDLAKIGLLLADNGNWAGRQVVSASYLRAAVRPSRTNSCYGYLFWLTGPGCGEPADNLPPGSFTTSGMLSQNNFVIPSLDMVVTWTGIGGTQTAYGLLGQFENTAGLAHDFFRLVFGAVRDVVVPDSGPYREPEQAAPEVRDFVQPDVLLAVLGVGPSAYPGCTVFSCLRQRLRPPFADAPPGCGVVVCVGPDPHTPGIRAAA